jgi:hypothetical protein
MTLTGRTSLVDRSRSSVGAVQPLTRLAHQYQRKRYRTVLISALAFVLLAAGLIFSFGLKLDGPASPTAKNLQARTVALVSGDAVTVRHVLCVTPAYSPSSRDLSASLPDICPVQYRVNDVTQFTSDNGYSTNPIQPAPALPAYPSTLASSTNSAHSVLISAVTLSGKSVSVAAHHLRGSEKLALSHHELKSATANNKDGHPTIHIAFTQVDAERWDALAGSNFHKDIAIISGVRVISVPIVEPQNTSFENFGPKLDTFEGSLIAAEAHQFASSL